MTTETNEERLEEIEEQYKWGISQSLACRNLSDSDIDWLILQAKQLNNIENRSVLNSLKECSEENASLREALLELSQGKFDCYEDECANFALKALAGDSDGQR